MRKSYSNDCKVKVALAALKGDKTVAELSSQHEVHANLIMRWVREAKEGLTAVFAGSDQEEIREIMAKNEELFTTRVKKWPSIKNSTADKLRSASRILMLPGSVEPAKIQIY